MDSLHDILSKKDFDEPPELAKIKKYVRDKYQVIVQVQARERDIVVTVPGAALANTLRLESPGIKRLCRISKRLVFRIG